MLKPRALVAELIGTFALIFVGVLAIYHLGRAEAGLIGIALAHGLVIACMASATAAVSGGHLNPAVSLAFFATKRIDLTTMLGYIVAQCIGAVLACLAIKMIVPGDAVMIIADGTPALGKGIEVIGAIIAEAIATFFLMFVIFGTAVDHRAPKAGALFIGLTVTFDIFAIGPSTGAAMNPARWLGPALVAGKWDNAIVYIIGPVIGAVAAALVYATMLEDKAMLAPSDPARVDAQ